MTQASLPIYALADDLVAACTTQSRLILTAPTGSGKSTQGINLVYQVAAFPSRWGGLVLDLKDQLCLELCTVLPEQRVQPFLARVVARGNNRSRFFCCRDLLEPLHLALVLPVARARRGRAGARGDAARRHDRAARQRLPRTRPSRRPCPSHRILLLVPKPADQPKDSGVTVP